MTPDQARHDVRVLRFSVAGMIAALGLLTASMIVTPWWHWILMAAAGVIAAAVILAFPMPGEPGGGPS